MEKEQGKSQAIELVASGIEAYVRAGNSQADLARMSGVSRSTISRLALRQAIKPDFETWLALHQAAPDYIPAPPILSQSQRPAPISEATILPGGMRQIPVFDAGAGEPSHFSDNGYPVGHAESYITLPEYLNLSKGAFAVKVHGDSMAPEINLGDTVVVDPEQRLENGQICFATWTDDECGQRLVKIYKVNNGNIMLLSKNPMHGPITLDPEKDQAVKLYKVVGHYRKY